MASELKKLSKVDKPDNLDREVLNASGAEAAESLGGTALAADRLVSAGGAPVQAQENPSTADTHPANNGRATKIAPAAPERPAARIEGAAAKIGSAAARIGSAAAGTPVSKTEGAASEGPAATDEKCFPLAEVDRFFDLVIAELSALRTRAEHEAIDRAVDLILDCEARGGRVHVTGVGKSEYVARYAASLLSSTGTPAYFLHATECVHGSAGQLCKSDIAIAISKSGKTPELMSAVGLLGEMSIRIIGVSADTGSPLANASDVLLYAGVENEGGLLNLAPRISILAQNYVLCGLSVALEIRKGLTREQYAGWHPGGVLGRLARGD
jgi:D-arabinose 5-phosphate isomerase GutQ